MLIGTRVDADAGLDPHAQTEPLMLSCTSTGAHLIHRDGCGCAQELPGLQRRRLLAFTGAIVASSLLGGRASAASGDYEAMLVNCIDPRFTTNSLRYMAKSGMQDRHSQFVIAGGPIGAVHEKFAPWHSAFWDNLDITVQLHHIKRVVAMTHRDCGAAKLAFGEAAVATRDAETTAHARTLSAFAAEVRRRKPALAVVAGIMDLDGSVDLIA